MVGHTGFLIMTRRLADGVEAIVRKRRPAKGAYPVDEQWSEEDLGERIPSDKKVRKVRRDVTAHRDELVEQTGEDSGQDDDA
jgi:tRNA (adenine57-N1/adenine58-N1)-methyltransferase